MKRLLPVLAVAALVAVPAASARHATVPTLKSGTLIVAFGDPAPGFASGTTRGNTITNPRGYEVDKVAVEATILRQLGVKGKSHDGPLAHVRGPSTSSGWSRVSSHGRGHRGTWGGVWRSWAEVKGALAIRRLPSPGGTFVVPHLAVSGVQWGQRCVVPPRALLAAPGAVPFSCTRGHSTFLAAGVDDAAIAMGTCAAMTRGSSGHGGGVGWEQPGTGGEFSVKAMENVAIKRSDNPSRRRPAGPMFLDDPR